MATGTLCRQMGGLRFSNQQSATAKNLSSMRNGIAAAPRISLSHRQHVMQAPAVVEIVCADGRRGGKLKTNKSAAKRYKITGGGKVMVRQAGKQHLNEKMKRAKISQLSKKKQVSDTKLNLIKGCLPYAGIK